MRGCVKAVLLLLVFSVSFDAVAQCDWTPRFSGQFRTTALDVAVDGDLVWVATGYGVQLLSNDTIVDSVALPAVTGVIAVDRNGYAYAGSGERLVVLRRDGGQISIVQTIPTGGRVNDILLASWMFVATSAGIEHYALLDPAAPSRTAVTLTTSAPWVHSLALAGTTLYAADGDASVETFSLANPSMPQPTGALAAMQHASAVHASPDGLVLVSDALGRDTEVFVSGTRVARLGIGSNAFAGDATGAHFLAGVDRTVRAVDLSSPATLVELLELQLAPTDGTDNVVHAMARSGDKVYVAAGDLGLITLDASKLALPRPMVAYASGRTNSVRTDGSKAWFATADGRIAEQAIDRNGVSLFESRNWPATPGAIVRDQNGNTLLTTTGPVATLWDLGPTVPVAGATITFPDAIGAAVLTDTATIALLANGSIWATPRGQSVPQRVQTPSAAFLARSGNTIAMAEVRAEEAKTVIHYSAEGNLAAPTIQVPVDGVATGGLALHANRAAVFTFRGVTTIDLVLGSTRVVPDSARIIPQQIILTGADLLLVDHRSLLVYAGAERLVREHPLPADVMAADAAASIAALATNDGVAALAFGRELPSPSAKYASNFYSKVAAAGEHIWLRQKDGVDGWTMQGTTPHFVTGIRVGGIVDIAASETALFTVAGNGTVTSWSQAGTQLAQTSIVEGTDSRPLAIHTAGGAVWLALSYGCTSSVCQQKTVVLDPATLAVTAVLPGGARDATQSGAVAHALFNMPNELRRYDVSDPLHPAQTASVAAPPYAASLASDGGLVHVLGERLYSFTATTLAESGVRFDHLPPTDLYQLRIADGCAVVVGRSVMPQLYTTGSWAAAPASPTPSVARRIAIVPGRLLLLTEHSFEVWANTASENPSRRRAAR